MRNFQKKILKKDLWTVSLIKFLYPKIKNENLLQALNNVEKKLFLFNQGTVSEELIEVLRVLQFDKRFTVPENLSGLDIFRRMIQRETTIEIKLYKQSFFTRAFYNVNAFTTFMSRSISFNERNLNRSVADIEETLWHETIHVMDFLSVDEEFHHGTNDLTGKFNTAPVKLAKILAHASLNFFSQPKLEELPLWKTRSTLN